MPPPPAPPETSPTEPDTTEPDTTGPDTTEPEPATPDAPPLEGAVIVSPAADMVVRNRDSVTVTVEVPLGDAVTLFVGDQEVPASQLGTRVYDEGRGRQTFEYVGVGLQPGPNLLRLISTAPDGRVLEDSLTLSFAGPPATVTLTPRGALVADSPRPLLIDLVVRDAFGQVPQDGFLTLELDGAVPAAPDANPRALGYQVRVTDGQAVLALEPIPEPITLTVSVRLAETTVREQFLVATELRPWVASAAGSIGSSYQPGEPLRFGLSGSLFARGTVYNRMLLTLGLRAPPAPLGLADDPIASFPVPGTSSPVVAPAQSQSGVYARLERDLSFLQFGDFGVALDGPVLDVTQSITGLFGHYQTPGDGFIVSGYAAVSTAGEEVSLDFPADGTSLYRLPAGPVVSGTLRVRVVKKSPVGDRLVEDGDPRLGELAQGVGYSFDPATAILLLATPLPSQDASGNRYALRVSYRLASPDDAPRALQFGLQVAYEMAGIRPRLGFVQAGVAEETSRVVAAGVGLETDTLTGDLVLAYGGSPGTGGFAFGLALGYDDGVLQASGDYRYSGEGFRSPTVREVGDTGQQFGLALRYRFGDALSLEARGEGAERRGNGSVFESRAELLGRYEPAGALRLGDTELGTRPSLRAGAELDRGQFRLVAGAGLRDIGGLGLSAEVLHRQGLAGASSITDFGVRYQLLDNLTVRLTERLEWGVGSALLLGLESGFDNADLFGVAGNLGRTSALAQYELSGGLSGEAGRVRLGVNTLYLLSDALSIDGGIEQIITTQGEGESATVVTLAGNYSTDGGSAAARYETRFGLTPRHLVTLGANLAVSDDFFTSITGRYLFDGAETPAAGFSLSLAAAYRGRVDLLTNHTATTGSLAADAQTDITGDTRAAVSATPTLDFRLGYLYRYRDTLGYQDMLAAGTTVYVWEGGSVSGFGRLFHDWTLSEFALGAGLELSQRLGCGFYGVLGYSLGGLGEPFGYGGPGLSLRADLVIDEQWRCGGEAQQ